LLCFLRGAEGKLGLHHSGFHVKSNEEELIGLSGQRSLTPVMLNKAKGEIRERYLSCAKAKSLLNWSHRTSLSERLSRAYSWYESFPEQNRSTAV